jgi:hypothetical protein
MDALGYTTSHAVFKHLWPEKAWPEYVRTGLIPTAFARMLHAHGQGFAENTLDVMDTLPGTYWKMLLDWHVAESQRCKVNNVFDLFTMHDEWIVERPVFFDALREEYEEMVAHLAAYPNQRYRRDAGLAAEEDMLPAPVEAVVEASLAQRALLEPDDRLVALLSDGRAILRFLRVCPEFMGVAEEPLRRLAMRCVKRRRLV